MPIIATGGPTEESILRTIEAGANAISYTPPSPRELFRVIMTGYRENDTAKAEPLEEEGFVGAAVKQTAKVGGRNMRKLLKALFDSAGGAAGGGHYLCGICDAEL